MFCLSTKKEVLQNKKKIKKKIDVSQTMDDSIVFFLFFSIVF